MKKSDTRPQVKPRVLDRMIHEPARLKIMALLYREDRADFISVARRVMLTRGNLSAHMTRLEQAGYIHVAKEFIGRIPRTRMSITPAGASAFTRYRREILFWLED